MGFILEIAIFSAIQNSIWVRFDENRNFSIWVIFWTFGWFLYNFFVHFMHLKSMLFSVFNEHYKCKKSWVLKKKHVFVEKKHDVLQYIMTITFHSFHAYLRSIKCQKCYYFCLSPYYNENRTMPRYNRRRYEPIAKYYRH